MHVGFNDIKKKKKKVQIETLIRKRVSWELSDNRDYAAVLVLPSKARDFTWSRKPWKHKALYMT